MLSKSKYVRGLKCPKSLWLNTYKSDQRVANDASMSLFNQGSDVGALARQYFPGGVLAVEENEIPDIESAKRTANLVENGIETIYEATFIYQNTLVAVDILVKIEGQWQLFEMKSTTHVKEVHINDVALQYYVVTNSGIPLSDASVMYLNNQYIKRGQLDMKGLFNTESVLDRILPIQFGINDNIEEFLKILASVNEPETAMGEQCNKPYGCDFSNYCLSLLPPQAETDPETLSRVPVVNRNGVNAFLNTLSYPLYFFDFETIMPCVPIFNESRPYQQIAFQYSLHFKPSKDANVQHFEFLGNADADPREALILQLIENTRTNGQIIVYNITFEKTRLKEMKRDFPQYENEIQNIIDRLVDLMPVFRQRHYVCDYMQGSYSIKKVLPALCPDFSYKNLNINNGGVASNTYYALMDEKDHAVISKTRNDLLAYCKLDTLAMVKILDVLEKKENMTDTKYLLDNIAQAIDNNNKENERTKERFNIFELLELTKDEVRLHSRFINELLNPFGSHQMKDTFLKHFIAVVEQKKGITTHFVTESATVNTEKYIGPKTENEGGYIDIIITDSNNHSIIIENKIFAKEGENQLLRYSNFKGCKSKTLLFLTLDGSKSKDKQNDNIEYYPISYSEDILNWLECCSNSCKEYPHLQQIIIHYIKTIKQLTGKSMDTKLLNEIETLIKSEEKYLMSSILIANHFDRFRKNIQKEFWKGLKSKAGEKFNITYSTLDTDIWDKRNENHRIEITLMEIKDSEKVVFAIESYNNLYFGFKYIQGNNHDCRCKDIQHFIEASNSTQISRIDKNWIRWEYPKFSEFPEKNHKLNLAFNEINNETDLVLCLTNQYAQEKVFNSIISESEEKIKGFCDFLKINTHPILKK